MSELPEEHELLEVLNASFYEAGDRTKMDRYREFRNVFMNSEEGKRVLYEILSMAKLSARLSEPYPHPVDVNRVLLREGARGLALDILKTITHEPVNEDGPTQTTRRPHGT